MTPAFGGRQQYLRAAVSPSSEAVGSLVEIAEQWAARCPPPALTVLQPTAIGGVGALFGAAAEVELLHRASLVRFHSLSFHQFAWAVRFNTMLTRVALECLLTAVFALLFRC